MRSPFFNMAGASSQKRDLGPLIAQRCRLTESEQEHLLELQSNMGKIVGLPFVTRLTKTNLKLYHMVHSYNFLLILFCCHACMQFVYVVYDIDLLTYISCFVLIRNCLRRLLMLYKSVREAQLECVFLKRRSPPSTSR